MQSYWFPIFTNYLKDGRWNISSDMWQTKINPALLYIPVCDDGTLAVCRMISEIVDGSQEDEGFIISHGVCEELDNLKHLYHGLPDLLTKVVESEMDRIPRAFKHGLSNQQWSLMYLPQVRVIPPFSSIPALWMLYPSVLAAHIAHIWACVEYILSLTLLSSASESLTLE